jgi:hypothetical protein
MTDHTDRGGGVITRGMIAGMPKRNPALPGETLGSVTITADLVEFHEWRRLVKAAGHSPSVLLRRYVREDIKRRQAAARV